MKISLTRNVKAPERGTQHSAGIDFFVPEYDNQFLTDFTEKNKKQIESNEVEISTDQMLLKPHARVLIPTGVHVNFQNNGNTLNCALVAFNKSGVSSNKGLCKLAEVVDSTYTGEVHISIVNTSTENQIIKPNEKLIQFILIPIMVDFPEVVEFSDLYKQFKTDGRDSGGFGSTGK